MNIFNLFHHGDLEGVISMINCNKIDNINACDDSNNYWTLLHYATNSNHIELVKLLISIKNININSVDSYGWTSLHKAISNGNYYLCEMLIAAGADINKPDNLIYTPLHAASSRNHKDICKLLIKSSSNNNIIKLNEKNHKGWSPLFHAVYNGNIEICQILIEAGASVHLIDIYFKTALFLASENGHLEIVKILIKNGADSTYISNVYDDHENPNPNPILNGINGRHTPISIASIKGHYNIVIYLIKEHKYQRRKHLILTRPHADHNYNKYHKLTPLGEIITAVSNKGKHNNNNNNKNNNNNDIIVNNNNNSNNNTSSSSSSSSTSSSSSHYDALLFQLKMKVASYL